MPSVIALVVASAAGAPHAAMAAATPTAAAARPLDKPNKPNKPTPTVASVTARLDTLSRRAEVLSEKYNAATIALRRTTELARAAQRRAAAAEHRLAVQRREFASWMVVQYQQGPAGSTAALLTSRNPGELMDQLAMADMLTRSEADRIDNLQDSQRSARTAQASAKHAMQLAQQRKSRLADSRRAVTRETATFTALRRTLTDRQRRAYSAQSSANGQQRKQARTVHAGSAAAQRAVDFALDQVGKPYVFGAAGPGAYDCSGLTMAAWQRGGVSLPHLAASQFNYGRRVSADELQPGDLVFLYDDLSHVSMYIGKGMLVSAPQPGENVKIVPFAYFRSDFVGGTRLA